MKANPNFTYLKSKVPEQRINLLQGGTRSGKTYSTIYYIIWLCKEYKNAGMEIDIVRDTFTALSSTVWHDFKQVLISHDLYRSDLHSKTQHSYILFGNIINYYGADTPSKIHGRSRDILWINECHQMPEETIDQLFPRTRHRIIGDYNPALPVEHWLDRYIDEYPPLITTYRDNPHLTDAQVEDIESRKGNKYWWAVYGTGERTKPVGAIFENWIKGEFKEFDFGGYGQDYGFSNDPTTLIQVSRDRTNKRIYCKECYYEIGLSTGQIYELNHKYAGSHTLIVGDSAEPRLISELMTMRNGLNIVGAEKGQGSITAGISLMWDYEIVIDPDSKNLIKEFSNYQWLDKTNKSVPEDKNNHGIDAVRYLVYKLLNDPHRGKYYIG
jgi:phage terminase large subunit